MGKVNIINPSRFDSRFLPGRQKVANKFGPSPQELLTYHLDAKWEYI